MTKFYGCSLNAPMMMLLTALMFASTIINSQCLPVAREEGAEDLELNNSVLELSSRDEILRMAGYGEDKLSTVLITGMVVCNKVCLSATYGSHQVPPQPMPMPMPISGALVAATCHTDNIDKRHTWAKAITDEYGEFIIDLPSQLHALQDLDKACSIRVLQQPPNSPCRQSAFAMKPKGIRLSSVGNGIRTYTTGKMMLLRTISKDSEACMKRQEDEQEMSW